MKVDIGDSDQLKALMSEALLRAIDEKSRDALIKQALVHLLAPGDPTYSGGKRRLSPLEEAYQWAVESYAKRVAHEILEKDEAAKEQIRSLLNEAMERAFTKHRDSTVDRVATAIAEGLWKRD